MKAKDKKPFNETKFGKFLDKAKNVVPDVLNVAGKIATGNISGAIEEVGDALKKKSESDQEAQYLLYEFEKYKLEYEKELEDNITKRWQSDMSSDSWLSKNVRPLTLAYLTLITTVYIILDSIEMAFNIDAAWIELLKTLLVTIYVAYFGSRGFEKYTQIKK